MKRVVIPELLDSDSGTPSEIADSLSDLQRINRRFGGLSTSQALIRRVITKSRTRSLSLLEVAAGSSELPNAFRAEMQERGIRMDVTLLDRAASHFEHRRNGLRAVAGDALALPFADASFDVVCCCLFAHHLEPPEIVQFVTEGLRVARTAVLINDLVRNPLHLALVYAARPLYHSRITRHDAPVSVRRAYTPKEIFSLMKQTNATSVEITRHFLFRMGVVIWK
jgi:ubiquinone/menaquinone biosynthesis C-methylase UbiE